MASPLRRSHLISVAYSFSTSRWEMHCRATEIKLLPVSHSTQSPLLLQQDAFVFVLASFLGLRSPVEGCLPGLGEAVAPPAEAPAAAALSTWSAPAAGCCPWQEGNKLTSYLYSLNRHEMKIHPLFSNACYINITVTDSPMIMFHKKKSYFQSKCHNLIFHWNDKFCLAMYAKLFQSFRLYPKSPPIPLNRALLLLSQSALQHKQTQQSTVKTQKYRITIS